MPITRPPVLSLCTLAAASVLSGRALAQQFQFNNADMPNTATGYTENVDYGDVDNDGDWDIVLADGGDFGNQQSRIWINAFNVGDPTGKFTNRTSTQFPVVSFDSRDIEFGDFNNDGDLDIYLSNTSQISNQSNRWWINRGGPDGGTVGFFVDQTAARWSGLGGAGSSIAPTQVLGSGGFIDFSCDCDFGDLDNDGDLDLVHSTYGGAFGGNVPTRLFLNDGTGVFSEFNPSGFQLPGQNISNGNPGLWCEGTQSANTTNATGANCDVASTPLDIDVGDIDGDFDLDILHGARQELPRLFKSRREENGGALGFRDVTGSSFPLNYSTGGGHYEQEMGDVDSDGDLDIYGLNWGGLGSGLSDNILFNDGNGVYGGVTVLPGSSSDDNEGDFFDYDLDGDLDLLIANFSGQERIYTNNGAGGYTLATGVLPSDGSTSLDADCADVDFDGDYDAVAANDGNQAEGYLKNSTLANDVTAPSIPRTEQAPNRTPSAAPTVVRAHVYDNAPYYVTWYNATDVEVVVNGGAPTFYPARSSQGQLFRAEIPGGLVGTIDYRFRSSDKYGNTGFSAVKTYIATGGAIGTPLCFGDGTGGACPCGNVGAAGRGCANSIVTAGALLSAAGNASVSSDSLSLAGIGMPNSSALYFQGDALAGAGSGVVFGDGLRCAQTNVFRIGTKINAGNASSYPQGGDLSVSVRGSVTSASTRYYQIWYRNADAAFCTPSTFNLSNALRIDWTL